MKQPWFLELNSQPEVKIYTSTPLAEASVTSEVFTKLGLASAELNLMDGDARSWKKAFATWQEKLLTWSWGNSLNDLLKEEGDVISFIRLPIRAMQLPVPIRLDDFGIQCQYPCGQHPLSV